LTDRQQHEAAALARRQALETLIMERRLRALALVEQRELRSLENALLKERRIEDRERSGRQPPPVEPSRDPHMDVFNGGSGRRIGRRRLNARPGRGTLTAIAIMTDHPATIRHRDGGGTGISIACDSLHPRPSP